jgi:predicted nucleic acid-binding protein
MDKLYLDTWVFIDILSGNPDHVRKAEEYLRLAKTGTEAVISAAMLAELSYHITKRKGFAKADEVLFLIRTLPNIEIISVDADIASMAGRLRAKYHKHADMEKKLTYMDCIHLATSIQSKCTKFVTGDRAFKDVKEIVVEVY